MTGRIVKYKNEGATLCYTGPVTKKNSAPKTMVVGCLENFVQKKGCVTTTTVDSRVGCEERHGARVACVKENL